MAEARWYPLSPQVFCPVAGPHPRQQQPANTLMNDDAMAPLFPDIHPAERHRFLAARDGNVEQAVEMLQSHLVWRSALALALANLKEPPLLIGSTLCAIG